MKSERTKCTARDLESEDADCFTPPGSLIKKNTLHLKSIHELNKHLTDTVSTDTQHSKLYTGSFYGTLLKYYSRLYCTIVQGLLQFCIGLVLDGVKRK